MTLTPADMLKRTQEYESDNGFVEDAPQSKKRKGGEKKPVSTETHQDDDGNEYWEVRTRYRRQVHHAH